MHWHASNPSPSVGLDISHSRQKSHLIVPSIILPVNEHFSVVRISGSIIRSNSVYHPSYSQKDVDYMYALSIGGVNTNAH